MSWLSQVLYSVAEWVDSFEYYTALASRVNSNSAHILATIYTRYSSTTFYLYRIISSLQAYTVR